MTQCALWDVLKFRQDYYFVTFNPNDGRNSTTLAPGGGAPPPSAKNCKLATIMKYIPYEHLIAMVEEFLTTFGHIGTSHIAPEEFMESPQSCSMRDFDDIKNKLISHYLDSVD